MAVNKTDVIYNFSHDMLASQLWRNAMDNQSWRYRQNVNKASEAQSRCVNIVVLTP